MRRDRPLPQFLCQAGSGSFLGIFVPGHFPGGITVNVNLSPGGTQVQHIIDRKLQELPCPVSLFVPITGGLIGRTRLTSGLKNDDLDRELVEKLVAILDEMTELKRTSLIAPDWSDAENIKEQLHQRRAFRQAAKYDEDRVRELLLGPHNATTGAT
jgi:hypothetical protein